MIERAVRAYGKPRRELSAGARQRAVSSELPFGSCAINGIVPKVATVCHRYRAAHFPMCVRFVP